MVRVEQFTLQQATNDQLTERNVQKSLTQKWCGFHHTRDTHVRHVLMPIFVFHLSGTSSGRHSEGRSRQRRNFILFLYPRDSLQDSWFQEEYVGVNVVRTLFITRSPTKHMYNVHCILQLEKSTNNFFYFYDVLFWLCK